MLIAELSCLWCCKDSGQLCLHTGITGETEVFTPTFYKYYCCLPTLRMKSLCDKTVSWWLDLGFAEPSAVFPVLSPVSFSCWYSTSLLLVLFLLISLVIMCFTVYDCISVLPFSRASHLLSLLLFLPRWPSPCGFSGSLPNSVLLCSIRWLYSPALLHFHCTWRTTV